MNRRPSLPALLGWSASSFGVLVAIGIVPIADSPAAIGAFFAALGTMFALCQSRPRGAR